MRARFRFNDDGARVDFTFDVVEMTPESQLTKIGSWSDKNRLQVLKSKGFQTTIGTPRVL